MYTNITEIKQAEEEIRLANSKLEQANDLVTEKNKELEALSTKLSKYLSPQVYSSIFAGAIHDSCPPNMSGFNQTDIFPQNQQLSFCSKSPWTASNYGQIKFHHF